MISSAKNLWNFSKKTLPSFPFMHLCPAYSSFLFVLKWTFSSIQASRTRDMAYSHKLHFYIRVYFTIYTLLCLKENWARYIEECVFGVLYFLVTTYQNSVLILFHSFFLYRNRSDICFLQIERLRHEHSHHQLSLHVLLNYL